MSSFCKCKSYSHFFSKNISVYAIFNDQSFNNTLTNDILSFEQLSPVCHYVGSWGWDQPKFLHSLISAFVVHSIFCSCQISVSKWTIRCMIRLCLLDLHSLCMQCSLCLTTLVCVKEIKKRYKKIQLCCQNFYDQIHMKFPNPSI